MSRTHRESATARALERMADRFLASEVVAALPAAHPDRDLFAIVERALARDACATCGGEGHPNGGPECPECGAADWKPNARGTLTRVYELLRDRSPREVDAFHLRELIGEAQEVLGDAGDRAADKASPITDEAIVYLFGPDTDGAKRTAWGEVTKANPDDLDVPRWRSALGADGYALVGGGATPRSALWLVTCDDQEDEGGADESSPCMCGTPRIPGRPSCGECPASNEADKALADWMPEEGGPA